MKALALWQPWASLVACGAKRIETRSWDTNYRGLVAICATQKEPPEAFDGISEQTLNAMYQALGGAEAWAQVPRGACVAVVRLARTFRMGGAAEPVVDARERSFGNWTPGRFGFELEDVVELPLPVPVVSSHRLFPLRTQWEIAIRQEVERAMARRARVDAEIQETISRPH